MKKFLSVLLLLLCITLAVILLIALLFLFTPLSTLAASGTTVCAEEASASPGGAVIIPVKLEGNDGIMGFKLTVSYDAEVLTAPRVNRGTLTERGSLNDSIGVTPAGSFDVVWSGTENAVGDGSIMILSFRASEAARGRSKISLTFSQPDTFNEAWQDVMLNCRELSVSFDGGETSERATDQSAPDARTTPDDAVLSAVDIALENLGYVKVGDVPEELRGELVAEVNDVLNRLTDAGGERFKSAGQLASEYENAVSRAYVAHALDAVDGAVISETLEDALALLGAESAEDVSEDERELFVELVEDALSERAPDLGKISDRLPTQKAAEVLGQLDNAARRAASEDIRTPEPKAAGKKSAALIALGAGVAAAAIVTTVSVIKQKSKRRY